MKIFLLERDAENYRWLEYKNIFVNYNGYKVSLFDYFHAHIVNVESMSDFNEIIECKTIRDKKERYSALSNRSLLWYDNLMIK